MPEADDYAAQILKVRAHILRDASPMYITVDSGLLRPMFSIKPANDTDEFYEAIERNCSERYQLINARIAFDAIRNHQTLPPQAMPASLEANTSLVPFPPHADAGS